MKELGYRMVDADNHFYEPDDCFTRHIEARFRDRTVRVDRESPDALGRVFIGAARSGFYSVAVGDHVGPPGMMRAFLRGEAEQGAVNASAIDARKVPSFVEKSARLDEQDVEACIMLPTLGIGVEYQLRRDLPALYPSLASYNRFLEETWGFGRDRRIFSTPLLSLADVDEAVIEPHSSTIPAPRTSRVYMQLRGAKRPTLRRIAIPRCKCISRSALARWPTPSPRSFCTTSSAVFPISPCSAARRAVSHGQP
jgi:hypothetical protein